MTDTVALNKLILSARNVRKTNGEEDIESLADSIHSKGLLQNLVVSEAPGGSGLFEVDAGGRRLRALQLNAKLKRIPRNWPVPVFKVPRDDATEASLAENLQKIAMNPADEVEAFAAIIDRYADNGVVDRDAQVANLARRFGRTVQYVEQRLRLAALAPEILDALRTGAITLDAAKAYAHVSDQALQLKVFAGQERAAYDKHRVAAIRAAYAGKVYRAGDRIVRYVGLDTYREHGGRIDRDLFMGCEEEELLTDTALVDRLAKEKADAEADRIAQEAGYRAGAYVPLTNAYFACPKPPAGYSGARYGEVPAAERDEAVLVLKLAEDGSALLPSEYHFPKAVPADAAAPPVTRGPETELERLARIRRQAIQRRAIHLAAPRVAGTALEGRAFWPECHARWIEPVEEDGSNYVVALLVTVPKADVEKMMAAAEREHDQNEAARDAARSAASGPDDENEDEHEPEEEAVA